MATKGVTLREEGAKSAPSEVIVEAEVNRPRQLDLSQFVFMDHVIEALKLAYESGEGILLYGAGGHAKSELVEAFVRSIKKTAFVKSLGEGTDVFDLFGGVSVGKMLSETDKPIEFLLSNSWIEHEIVVFEEFADSPPQPLMALKDVISSRFVRNGNQLVPIKTRMIVAITNKSPEEIGRLGPSAKALLERFPIQVEVKWDRYNTTSYLTMFKAVGISDGLNGQARTLATAMADASSEGDPISPRTAVKAFNLMKASAKIRGSNKVGPEDMKAIRFLPGLGDAINKIEKEREAEAMKQENEVFMVEMRKVVSEMVGAYTKLVSESAGIDSGLLAIDLSHRMSLLAGGITDYLTSIEDRPLGDPHHAEREAFKNSLNSHKRALVDHSKNILLNEVDRRANGKG